MTEVPVETPTQAILDVSSFQRVLVAGFIGAGLDDVDTNVETVRLLRSQLRWKSSLKVVEAAEALPPLDTAVGATPGIDGHGAAPDTRQTARLPTHLQSRKDLEQYGHVFANAAFWQRVGEEYQHPLIVTGSVLFTVQSRRDRVPKDRENVDSFGRRRVVAAHGIEERTVYVLELRFIFIDGRTGAVMYSETFREEVAYDALQEMPALSTYFELMDRMVPRVLGIVSDQTRRSSRTLLK